MRILGRVHYLCLNIAEHQSLSHTSITPYDIYDSFGNPGTHSEPFPPYFPSSMKKMRMNAISRHSTDRLPTDAAEFWYLNAVIRFD